MDTNEAQHPATSLLTSAVAVLDTEGLLELTQEIGDELLRRAYTAPDEREKRLLHLSAVHLVELRGRLRLLRAYEIEHDKSSAAPVPVEQHGAAQTGAPTNKAPSGAGSTTAGAAGVSHAKGCRAGLCEMCLNVPHRRERTAEKCFAAKCANVVNYYSCTPGYCVECAHNCECTCPALKPLTCERCRFEGIDHEGECRPVEGPETAPLSPSPSQSELQSRGPRGPEAAEGAGEAGRAKKGPVDLAYHLAVLKGGAA